MEQKVLRHVVLFSFLETATKEDVLRITNLFHDLERKIDGVDAIESGLNESPEGLNKGLSHCFIVTFYKAEARDLYLTHPEHMAFVDQLKPLLKDVCVVDFWSTSKLEV